MYTFSSMTPSIVNIAFILIFIISYSVVIEGKKSEYEKILNVNNPKCTDKALQKMELKMVKLLSFGPKGRPFPASLDQMKQFCNDTTSLSKQIESFAKECFIPAMRNLVTVFLYSIKSSFNRNYCGKNLKTNTRLIKNAACFNRHYISKYQCFEEFNNKTRILVNVKVDKDKIPHTCCNFHSLLSCLTKLLDAHSCSAPYRDEFIDVIRRSTAGLVDIVCSDYTEETDKCQRLGPSPSAPNKKFYSSFILALLDLMASMESFGE